MRAMELAEQIGMVLVVFALLAGLVFFTRRHGVAALGPQRGRARQLESLERIQLTPQHAIHLVRIADKTVLIATAPSACTLLDTPSLPELARPAAERGFFAK